MSATVISEPVMVTVQETLLPSSPSSTKMDTTTTTTFTTLVEIESAKCDCCGLTEECTPGYIERIRERYAGKWICGLCAEAVKDEIVRSDQLIVMEEALAIHFKVCGKFRYLQTLETDPMAELISAVRQILRRGLECTRGGGGGDVETGGIRVRLGR